MSKPNYRIHVTFDAERKVFQARAPELSHCSGEGATRAEAIARVEEEIDAQVQNIHAQGGNPPPAVDEETFSGEIAAKVSRTLHRDLAWQARSEGIEMDQLVGELLAAAVEGRRGTRAPRGGNRPHPNEARGDDIGNAIGNERPRHGGGGRGGYGGGRYNQGLLDDRANFIEYVRGLEAGTGQQGRMGGGGGGGGGGMGGGRRRRRGGRGGMGGGGMGGGGMGGGGGGGGGGMGGGGGVGGGGNAPNGNGNRP